MPARTTEGRVVPVVLLVVIGAVAGWLAVRLIRIDMDLPAAVALGVVGALAGGFGLRLLAAAAHGLAFLLAAVTGAVLALWLGRKVAERR